MLIIGMQCPRQRKTAQVVLVVAPHKSEKMQVFRTLKAEAYTRGLAYETEGVYIASVSAAGHLQVWDIATGKAECSLRKAAPKVCTGRARP